MKTITAYPVMLPTAFGNSIHKNHKDNSLSYRIDWKEMKGLPHSQGQHLYFISDKTPALQDWCLDGDNELRYVKEINNKTGLARHIDDTPFILDGCKKIVATSDKFLIKRNGTIEPNSTDGTPIELSEFIPQIPESFQEKWVKLDGNIESVELEIEEIGTGKVHFPSLLGDFAEYCGLDRNQLKRTEDNEVIINL